MNTDKKTHYDNLKYIAEKLYEISGRSSDYETTAEVDELITEIDQGAEELLDIEQRL